MNDGAIRVEGTSKAVFRMDNSFGNVSEKSIIIYLSVDQASQSLNHVRHKTRFEVCVPV